MLVEFRVENYRSVAEEQRLVLSASKDKALTENVHDAEVGGGIRLLKSAVLYGPNGSGKSNLIRAAALMRHLVVDSVKSYQTGDELPIEPFRLDPGRAAEPSRFEATFVHDGVRYQYGFVADRVAVHEEWLLAYPEGRAQTWFQRAQADWYFGPSLKGEKQRIADLTRPNALFLSVAASLNQRQLSAVYSWFQVRMRILAPQPWLPKSRGYTSMLDFTVSQSLKDPTFKDKIVAFLRSADVGIAGFDVERRKLEETDLPAEMPQDVRRSIVEMEFLDVRTTHQATDGSEVDFDLQDESHGTQALFELAGPWIDTVQSGYVVLIDELFSNLHPMLTRQLVQWFHTARPGGAPAQIVLTTHDTTLLDPEVLRRDQIWFLEKDRNGASRLYSLLEYKPRKDEAFQRGYLTGRYGAIPFFGDLTF